MAGRSQRFSPDALIEDPHHTPKKPASMTGYAYAQLTRNKNDRAHRKYFRKAKKVLPNARKTDPKVLLVTPLQAPSFEVQHRCSENQPRRNAMQWIDPDFCDLRLGFEVTAYVYVR